MKISLSTMLLSMTLLIGPNAGAAPAPARIYCPGRAAAFYATVVQDPKGGVSFLKDARILGAFTQTQLNCSWNTQITGVHCAGYLNDRVLIGASFAPSGSGISVTLHSLEGAPLPGFDGQTWACTF